MTAKKDFTICVSRAFETFERVKVPGREVDLGFPYVAAFIHREIKMPKELSDIQGPRDWVVSDINLGHAIERGRTQKQALEKAKAILAKLTHEQYEEAVQKVENRMKEWKDLTPPEQREG